MIIEQIYTGCLAQGAYYIESEGEAAIIDPLREVAPYLARATRNNAQIKYVFETHFHADFVSGHVDLAKHTGASIVFGPQAKTGFDAHIARDGEIFKLGKIQVKALHTPGHTMESTCYLLSDENGRETAIFTGDTLFIGDVGRPDLAQNMETDMSREKLAGYLYHSLRNKILPLPDHILVYPAHGAGSACGKNMSKETSDTLGHQKSTNYALQDISEEEFIQEVISGLLPPPNYFSENVSMNQGGYDPIEQVLSRGLHALTPEAFEQVANTTGAVMLDTRPAEEFGRGFIPNSINIGIDGSFAPWVGALITDIRQPLLVVAEDGREEEVVTRLARVGYEQCLGYLNGGFRSWLEAGKETDQITAVTANQLSLELDSNPALQIVDVRKPDEYRKAHLAAAINLPLDAINLQAGQLDKNKPAYIHCAGGYRSMIFASILRARGYKNISNVTGGFKAILDSGKFNTRSLDNETIAN